MGLNRESKRAIVILSGGIDSIVSMLWLCRMGWELKGLYINFGTPDSKAEMKAIKKYTESRNIPVIIVDVDISQYYDKGSYIEKRTDIMLAIASSFSKVAGTNNVILGNLRSDKASDLQYTYITQLARTLGISVIMPFCGFSKPEVIWLAEVMDIDLSHTWSCWTNSKEPCMACDGCGERIQAFKLAGSELC